MVEFEDFKDHRRCPPKIDRFIGGIDGRDDEGADIY
jgi:hypothetical protein